MWRLSSFLGVMHCEFTWNGATYRAQLSDSIDLSITLSGDGKPNPSAWYVDPPTMEPVRGDGFVGEVVSGGSVNFRNVLFNPHGHGTHTECMGHITPEIHPVDPIFRNANCHFPCAVISAKPKPHGLDLVVDSMALSGLQALGWPPAVVVRTLPNPSSKKSKQWSNTNPPYFTTDFMAGLVAAGVEHLLVDLPSVDREVDGGQLAAHHAFWGLPNNPRAHCTITELVYVPQNAPDGLYLLDLQVAPFDNDAAPSRPIIYPAHPVG